MDTNELMEEWAIRGACVGVGDIFFDLREPRKAKLREICNSCSVSGECLDFALFSSQTEGWWAGTTPSQRQAMLEESTDPRAVEMRRVSAAYNRHTVAS